MPKLKTHKGCKKRFKKTKKGKVKRGTAGTGHLLTGKNGKKKRQMKNANFAEGAFEKKIKDVL